MVQQVKKSENCNEITCSQESAILLGENERKLVYEKEKISHMRNGETCTIENIESSIASNAFIGLGNRTERERKRVCAGWAIV